MLMDTCNTSSLPHKYYLSTALFRCPRPIKLPSLHRTFSCAIISNTIVPRMRSLSSNIHRDSLHER